MSRCRLVPFGWVACTVVLGVFSVVAAASDSLVRAPRANAMLAAAAPPDGPQLVDETMTTTTYRNPDGTLTTDIATGPIRVPDATAADGWAGVDTSLEHGANEYHPAAAAADVSFSDGGAGDLASIGTMGGSDAYTLEWPGLLPTPTIAGDTATYADVWPGIDLVLQARPTGFSQRFIIRQRPTQPLVLRFPLELRGLHASVDEAGALSLTNNAGERVAGADPAQMWGAEIDPRANEPTKSSPVDVSIVQTPSGPILEERPDPAFLADPSVSYPVTVDPSPDLSVSADTYVSDDYPGTSYGGGTLLKSGTYNGGSTKDRSYIRFSGFAALAGQRGASVSQAILKLYETWSYSCTPSTLQVWGVDGAFSTSTTWNSQPNQTTMYASSAAANGYSSSCPDATVWLAGGGSNGATLADLVQKWVDGSATNYGFRIRAAGETDSNGWKQFNSNNAASHQPTITVTYDHYPATPSNLAPADNATLNDTTPTLSATYQDEDTGDAGSGRARFWITGPGVDINGADGTAADPGDTSSYIIPNALTSGQTYTWTARAWDGTLLSSPTLPRSFTVQPTPPTTPTVSGGSAAWTNAPQVVMSASGGGGTVARYDYRMTTTGGAPFQTGTGSSVTVSTEGPTEVQFQAVDAYSQKSAWTPTLGDSTGLVLIDTTPPTVPSLTGGSATWKDTSGVDLVISGGTSDSESGFSHYASKTSTDGGVTWSAPSQLPAGVATIHVSRESETLVKAASVDVVGNTSTFVPDPPNASGTVRIDTSPPTLPTPQGGSSTWRSSGPIVISASGSTDTGSGVAKYQYETSTNGGAWSAPADGSSVSVTAEGETLVRFRAVDVFGHVSDWTTPTGTSTARIDSDAPTLQAITGGSQTWANAASITITSQWADMSGLSTASYQTSTDNGATWSAPHPATSADHQASATISAEGETLVRLQATDLAAHTSDWTQPTADSTVRIDRTAPAAPSISGGDLAWSSAASKTITAASTDQLSGVAGYEYQASTDGGATWTAPGQGSSVTVTAEGETDVQFRAIDAAGNISAWAPATGDAAGTIRLDRTPPTYPLVTGGSFAWQAGPVTITASASSDALSGLDHYEYRSSTDGAATWTSPSPGATTTASAPGETLVQYRSVDHAGNTSDWTPTTPTPDSTVRIGGGGPTITSTTHPDPTQAYLDTTFDAAWSPPEGMPTVSGYGVIVDASPDTVPATVTQAGGTFEQANLDPGTYFLHVRAEDGSGHWSSTATYRFTVFGLISPADPSYTNSLISLQAAVPRGASDVLFQFRIDDTLGWSDVPASRSTTTSGGPATFPAQEDGSTGATPTFAWDAAHTTASDPGVGANAPSVQDGWIALRATMTDSEGNQISTPVVVANLDQTPPNFLTLTRPATPTGAHVVGSTVPVTWTPDPSDTDIAGYSVVVDNEPNTDGPKTIDAPSSLTSQDITATTAGTRYVHIRAVDASGNWSATQTYPIVFADQTLTSPADGTTVNGDDPIALSVATDQDQYVCWQYGIAADDTWTTIPTADVTQSGTSISGWPQPIAAGSDTAFNWAHYATADQIADWPGRIRLRAVAVPSATSDCSDAAASTVATTNVDFQPPPPGTMDLRQLASPNLFQPSILPFATPPPNGPIYYTAATRWCGYDRTTMANDGSDKIILASRPDPNLCDGPRSSPDFAASGDGTIVVWADRGTADCTSDLTIRGDTTSAGTTTVAGIVGHLTVSPDGTHIAYSAYDCVAGTNRISVVPTSAPGSPPTQVAVEGYQPTFADDTNLMWVDASGSLEFAPIDGTATPQSLLSGVSFHNDGLPASWSPVSHQLAVQTDTGTIVLIDASGGLQGIADGEGTTTTLPFGADVTLGPYSPDGQNLLLGVIAGGDSELVIYQLGSNQVRQVAFTDAISSIDQYYIPESWTTLPTGDALARLYRPYLRYDSGEKWFPIDADNLFNEVNPSTGSSASSLCVKYYKTVSASKTGRYVPPPRIDSKLDCSQASASGSPATIATAVGGLTVRDFTQTIPGGYSLSNVPTNVPTGYPFVVEPAIDNEMSTDGTKYHSPGIASCSGSGAACDPNDGTGPMYYHMLTTQTGQDTTIEYWMFYRFNDGSQDGAASLYSDQHQGDWEGVSVTIDHGGRLVSAAYSEHKHWYTYTGAEIDGHNSVADGRYTTLDGTHLVVYPGKGTHADYPYRCDGSFPGCLNYDAGQDIGSLVGLSGIATPFGEGAHQGQVDYYNNDDANCAGDTACVVNLDDSSEVNAFPLALTWGLSHCSAIGYGRSACPGLGDSPPSPARQSPYAGQTTQASGPDAWGS